MSDRSPLYRFALKAVTVFILAAFASGSAQAGTGGMLSNRAVTESVQDALLVSADATPAPASQPAVQPDRQTPGTVALISAVLPGYGQVYNNSVWKLPIYYGLMGYFGWKAADNNDKYEQYRDEYENDPSASGASDAAKSRDDYRAKRNTQLVLLCITYVAGIVDAYVDAHLYDFDRISDEGLSAVPVPGDTTTLLSVTRKF
jgi:hypothetical protein